MVTSKKAVVRISLIILVLMSMIIVPIQAQEDEVTLPEDTPRPWMMEYEPPYIWFAGDYAGEGWAVIVDTRTVRTDPIGSVKKAKVAPAHNPEGSSPFATIGIDYGGGFVWTTTSYSGSDIGSCSDLITRINPITRDIHHYWLKDVRRSRDIEAHVGRGTLFLACKYPVGGLLKGTILEFDPVTSTIVDYWIVEGAPYDLLIDGDYVWFTCHKLGKLNLVNETITYYDTASNPMFLVKCEYNNRIYFSENNNNAIGYIDPETEVVVERHIPGWGIDTGEFPSPTGPCGLVCHGKYLIVAGYYAFQVKVFNIDTETIVATYDYSSMPYLPVIGTGLDDVWCWGQGSGHMIYVDLKDLESPKNKHHGYRGTIHYTKSFFDDGAFGSDYVTVTFGLRGRITERTTYNITITAPTGEQTFFFEYPARKNWNWVSIYFGPSVFQPGENTITLSCDGWKLTGYYLRED